MLVFPIMPIIMPTHAGLVENKLNNLVVALLDGSECFYSGADGFTKCLDSQ